MPGRIPRAWLGLLSTLGCAQADVVAVERAVPCQGSACACADGDCACSAAVCPSLFEDAQASFCDRAGFAGLSGDACSTRTGARTHAYALCSCSDYTAGGSLDVDAFGATPTLLGTGDVGINGDFNASDRVNIAGTLRLSGVVSGDIGSAAFAADVVHTETPPCDCAPARLLAVPAALAEARARNDNASISLDARALDGVDGSVTLALPCGRFHLTRIAASGPVRIDVSGHAALFVDANLELDSSFEVRLAADARLELFVGGDLRVTGALTLGDPARGQASLRVHVAGSGSLNLQGTSVIAGVLDAPNAELVTGESLEVYGAVLVRRAAPEAKLRVHYDTSLATSPGCGG